METGKLNKRITIQRQVESKQGNFNTYGWQDYKNIWANVNNLFGREYWSAKEYNAENTVVFTIRWNACKDLSIKDRILFQGRLFNISSIDNIQYSNDDVKIKAMEVL